MKAIYEMTPASCKKEARRLMGMVNHLNKFRGKLAKYSSYRPNMVLTGQAWLGFACPYQNYLDVGKLYIVLL